MKVVTYRNGLGFQKVLQQYLAFPHQPVVRAIPAGPAVPVPGIGLVALDAVQVCVHPGAVGTRRGVDKRMCAIPVIFADPPERGKLGTGGGGGVRLLEGGIEFWAGHWDRIVRVCAAKIPRGA